MSRKRVVHLGGTFYACGKTWFSKFESYERDVSKVTCAECLKQHARNRSDQNLSLRSIERRARQRAR